MIGRDVDVDVLRAAAQVDEDTLVRSLDDLWRRRVLRERSGGDGHGGSDDFSHDLIRQVVLDATPPAQRRRLHERIATALERVHARDPDRAAALVAAHLASAGATGRAAAWFRRAARVARACTPTTKPSGSWSTR